MMLCGGPACMLWGSVSGLSGALQVQQSLQEFAWTERDMEARLEQRLSKGRNPEERAMLGTSPLFCFETSVICHRWSQLAYYGAPCCLGE